MKIKIKRFDRDLPLPEYKTAGAAGLDCCARTDVTVPAGKTSRIPLNVALDFPEGYFVLLAARGSLHKHGLFLANGVGIGDCDFCGDDDEYHAVVYNFTDESVEVKRGERIAQMLLLQVEHVEWEEVESLGNRSRGAFGTTGK